MKLLSLLVLIFLAGCAGSRKLADSSELRFAGEYRLPNGLSFNNTMVGGLSGIDYDEKHDLYYLICDDASVFNPVRFYTARIELNEKGIDSVTIQGVTFLKRPDGSNFPDTRENPREATDPEAMRYNARTGQLVFSSEGERRVLKGQFVQADGLIRASAIDGTYQDSFALPSNLRMHESPKGPRHNSVFEGVAFADNYRTLYVSVEEPLYEDGPQAGLGDSSAWVRFLKFDATTHRQVAQYAYRVEPVAEAPIPASAFRLNGVTDILDLGHKKLLVVERSYSTGHKINTIRVFTADLSKATDVSGMGSLTSGSFRPIEKKPLVTIRADNIEGVTLGPRLPNGHRTLIFVSDDNFSEEQVTQFLLYEIMK